MRAVDPLADDDAGVVDQDVDRAYLAHDLFGQGLVGDFIGHIQPKGPSLAALLANVLRHLLGVALVQIGDDDTGPGMGQPQGNGPPIALTTAGDQGQSTLQNDRGDVVRDCHGAHRAITDSLRASCMPAT